MDPSTSTSCVATSGIRSTPARSCKRPRTDVETPKPIASIPIQDDAAAAALEKAKADEIAANPFLSLVDDCVFLIMQLLEEWDILTLTKVHSRFLKLFKERAKLLIKKITLTRAFLQKYPLDTHCDMYALAGESATALQIWLPNGDETEKLFMDVLKHFPNLTDLELPYSSWKLKCLRGVELFPQTLEWINFGGTTMTPAYRKRLFDRLKGSLAQCDYSPPKTYLDFEPLVNMKILRLPIHRARHGLKELMARLPNIVSLEVFYTETEEEEDTSNKCSYLDWRALEQAQHLKKLRILGMGTVWPQMEEHLRLNNIETLNVELVDGVYWCVKHLLTSIGPQLKHLIIECEAACPEPFELFESIRHLTQLETLLSTVHMGEDEEENIWILSQMKSVKRLEYLVECPDVAMQIVAAMPQLEEYSNDMLEKSAAEKFEGNLGAFLKKNGRKIKFNGVMWPKE